MTNINNIMADRDSDTETNTATQNTPTTKKPYFLLGVVVIAVILCDQILKIWVEANISFYRPVKIIGNLLRLILAHNPYLIFGIPVRNPIVYYVLPVIGILVVIYLAFKTRRKFLIIAFGLIIGGAIGNLIDRVRLGYVIDFIDMGIKNLRWATYNIADAAIDIGLVMIIAREIFKSKPKS
jgi:signal peptidase II